MSENIVSGFSARNRKIGGAAHPAVYFISCQVQGLFSH
jgi:hypothetical protein